MKVFVEDCKLVGGKDLDINITEELLQKYISEQVDIDNIEYDVDSFVEQMVYALHLDLRYGTDQALLALAVVMECLNASDDWEEFDKCLAENTPFDNGLSGFIMFILCQLEANEFIHDIKYCTLTEKGKVLLWLFRQFEFADEDI